MKLHAVTIFLAVSAMLSAQSHFDNIDWHYTKTDKGIRIYTASGGECNYYKAEMTAAALTGVTAADLTNAINDFVQYLEIFKKVEEFQPLGQTDKGQIIKTRINFSPMNDRVYHIEMWSSHSDDTYITEWQPYTGDIDRTVAKNQKYVTHIYGRWTFRDNPDGSVYICTEHNNNWDYTGLSLSTVTPFEQNIAAKNVRLIYEYVVKTKKHK